MENRIGFENILFQASGIPALLELSAHAWHTRKHRKLNKVFAARVLLPLRIIIGETEILLRFADWLASLR